MSSSADHATSFNLTVASMDYPDSFQGNISLFTTGLDAYMDDEIILDLTQIIEENCPNYVYESSKEDVAKGVITDTGRRPGFFGIKRTFQPSFLGPIIRQDWLNNLGLEQPDTLSELEVVLTAFRDNYPDCIAPGQLAGNGIEMLYLSAWNINNSFYKVDDVVEFEPIQDEFFEYLTLMNEWYTNGLLDPEFYSFSTWGRGMDTASTLNGLIGYWNGGYSSFDTLMQNAAAVGDTEYLIKACKVAKHNEGDMREIGLSVWMRPDRFQSNIGTINYGCENPELLARWYDYLFSYEGSVLCSYGAGSAFYYDENGNPKANELIYANPDGLSPNEAIYYYAMNADMPALIDWERELYETMGEDALGASDIWDSDYEDTRTMPVMASISAEEGAEYSAIMGDIETYIDEMVVKFIIGEEPLSGFEEFRETIENLGIERATEIKQNSLDRYNAR